MSRLTFALLAGSALAAAASTSVEAQYYDGYGPPGYYNAPPPIDPFLDRGPQPGARVLPPRAIRDRLDDMGFDDIGRPHFTGTLYIVEATGPGGMRQRLVVDAVRGVILNRTALGGPGFRGRDDDDDDDDRAPRRRYGSWPDRPAPYGERLGPAPAPAPREDWEFRRDGREARPGEAPVTGRALPPPADPRLAPGRPGEPPLEGRSGREASRVEPGPARPYGTNPDAAKPALRKPPEQQARRPQEAPAGEPASPSAKPNGSSPGNGPAGKPTAEVKAKPKGPVRVIEGVTPMGPASGNAAGAGQLDNLPEPPPVPRPEVR